MHISRVDLNLFVVLDTIYTEGGLTRASEKLNLTQPAVSHALARLRELFGDPLFERRGHSMVPTPLTRSMIESVRASLRMLESTLHKVDRFDPATTAKRFVLGLRDVLEPIVLPPLMRRLAEEAPAVEVATARIDRRSLESELSAGTVDVAIDVLLPLSDKLRSRRISSDRLIVLARRDHPLLRNGLTLETYLCAGHILVSSRRRGRALEDLELSRLGLQRTVRLRCQHYFAAAHVVSQTDLLLTIPERHAAVANRQFRNQVFPFPIEGPTLDAYLYWHANAEEDPANRWFRRHLEAVLAKLAGGGRGERGGRDLTTSPPLEA
jgi:Transcriptional regulator